MSFVQYLESAGVILLAIAGAVAGLRTSRLRPPWWLAGFVVPVAFFAAMALGRWVPRIAAPAPLCWIHYGRTELVAAAFMVPYAFATLAPKLPRRRERIFLAAAAAMVVCSFCVLPFLLPALLHGRFAAMATVIDRDGVCMQHTSYTCGPAAAVTALRCMGLSAAEGEIAILAGTNPIDGTDPDVLAAALRARYGGAGLACEFRFFESLDELRRAGLTIALVKLGFLIDHYVVVLEVGDRFVVVGDPLAGRRRLAHADFMARWRRTGIVLARAGAGRPGA